MPWRVDLILADPERAFRELTHLDRNALGVQLRWRQHMAAQIAARDAVDDASAEASASAEETALPTTMEVWTGDVIAAPHLAVVAPDSEPVETLETFEDAVEETPGASDAPPPVSLPQRLTPQMVYFQVEGYLSQHPEIGDVLALRGLDPAQIRQAVAYELFGDNLLKILEPAARFADPLAHERPAPTPPTPAPQKDEAVCNVTPPPSPPARRVQMQAVKQPRPGALTGKLARPRVAHPSLAPSVAICSRRRWRRLSRSPQGASASPR